MPPANLIKLILAEKDDKRNNRLFIRMAFSFEKEKRGLISRFIVMCKI